MDLFQFRGHFPRAESRHLSRSTFFQSYFQAYLGAHKSDAGALNGLELFLYNFRKY